MSAGLRLTSLHSYPVKSCAGLAHASLALVERGPPWDRHWVVVDARTRPLTQRELPRLARVRPRVVADALVLQAGRGADLRVALRRRVRRLVRVEIWGSVCEAWDEGDEVAGWLSEVLGQQARLLRIADDFSRAVDPERLGPLAVLAFADEYPLLITCTASLHELNRRLEARGKTPIPMARFRPNIVIDGSEPFAEDGWRVLRIGGCALDLMKPCARCAITTVDPATGTVPDATEPLGTLASFRRREDGVHFGVRGLHRGPGDLTVGDAVEVLEQR